MLFNLNFNQEKDQLLKATRGVSFEDVINALEKRKLIRDKRNPSSKFSHQRIYVIEIKNYIYVVPYVVNKKRNEIFLKTIYSSRVLTKKYLQKGKDEKTKKWSIC